MTSSLALRSLTGVLLLAALGATAITWRPRAVPKLHEPPPGHLQAKGDAIFASSFKQFSSARVALAPYKGQPLIVYFWASWCTDCRADTAALMALHQRHATDGLTVIAIGTDQSDLLARYVREQAIDFPVYVGGQEGVDLSKRLGNLLGQLPYTAAIDRRGAFVAEQLGPSAPGRFEALAAAALK